MKKFIIIAIITIILIGGIIFFALYKSDGEVVSLVNNAQMLEVYDFSTNELLTKYEDQEAIEDFIKKLNVDKWELGSPDSGDLEKYLIKVYKTPTRKLFQKNDGNLSEVGMILIYESGEYISFSTNGINVDFKTNTDLANIF